MGRDWRAISAAECGRTAGVGGPVWGGLEDVPKRTPVSVGGNPNAACEMRRTNACVMNKALCYASAAQCPCSGPTPFLPWGAFERRPQPCQTIRRIWAAAGGSLCGFRIRDGMFLARPPDGPPDAVSVHGDYGDCRPASPLFAGMQGPRDTLVSALRHVRRARSDPGAKRNRRRDDPRRPMGSGQNFRGMDKSGGNGPPLLPQKSRRHLRWALDPTQSSRPKVDPPRVEVGLGTRLPAGTGHGTPAGHGAGLSPSRRPAARRSRPKRRLRPPRDLRRR